MISPIAISLSPNTTTEDVLLAVKTFIKPWRYVYGKSISQLEQWFCKYFDVLDAVSFVSGRTALFAILKALDIGKGDEVLLQAFTCVAVPNSVLWADAKPVYVDIDSTLTMDVKNIKMKITKKTKAIIVQHTFGIPADMVSILKIAKKHRLFVIEDCAHVIGGSYKNKKLGTLSDASFFSFGRDKAFSSVFGGMVITNNSLLGKKIREYQKLLPYPSAWWIMQQLFHPVAFWLALPLYKSGIGKLLLVILQKLHLLSFPVSSEEKEGKVRKDIIKKLPNALSDLGLLQLKRVEEFNSRRKELSSYYIHKLSNTKIKVPVNKEYMFLRFPVLVNNKYDLLKKLGKENIYLGNWYSTPIDPKGVDFQKIYYTPGSCKTAEEIAEKVINLPTYPKINTSSAKKIVLLLKAYAGN